MQKILLAIAASLLCLGIAHAQLYKWVDKDGRTQYSDKPPPKGTKSQVLVPEPAKPAPEAAKPGAKPSAADAKAPPVQRQDRVRTQFDFSQEEQQALRAVCAIHELQTKVCRPGVKRICTMEELLSGVPGWPNKTLLKDPRRDPNYEYRFAGKGNNFAVSANARKPGLFGFVKMSDGTHYNTVGRASGKDAKVQGALTCPDYLQK